LNKNNKYKDQIEYRILTLTCGTVGLTRGHFKKI